MADYFRSSLSDGRSPSPSAPKTPLTPSTPSLRSNNALTAKVNSVLSASYADLEIKDALALLDERDVRNTAETRRRLRLDVQKDVIDTNGAVIKEFGTVAEQLKRIGATLATLHANYTAMKKHVTLANQETAPVLEESKDLLARKEDGEKKSRLLDAFRQHFLMSEDDLATLTSTAEPVNDRFFTVLSRARTIQKDCTVLLTDETHQRLGTEIHERTSHSVDRAFEKLHRWTTREFKSLNLENPSLNTTLRTALKVLAERPSLFQSCLDAFAEAREKTLADLFYSALTGQGQHGGKAIEEEAHDAMRYVGDMAAWVHSATVSEREALETLFLDEGEELSANIKKGREIEVQYEDESESEESNDEDLSPGSARKPRERRESKEESVFDGRKALNQLVDRDISAATRTLRQRVEAVLSSIEEPVLSYKISHLLGFYHITFLKLFGDGGSDSTLVSTILLLKSQAFSRFSKLSIDEAISLEESLRSEPYEILDKDLSVPEWLRTALSQLSEIFKTFDSSLAAAMATREEQWQEVEDIFNVAYKPYMDLLSWTRGRFPDDRMSVIFQLNAKAEVKRCLERSEYIMNFVRPHAESTQRKNVTGFAVRFYDEIREDIEELKDDLMWLIAGFLREGSGCLQLMDLVSTTGKDGKGEMPPRSIKSLEDKKAFSPEALEEASQKLDDFLPSALMDAMDQLRQLKDESLKRDVVEDAVEKFCTLFEQLEDALEQMSVEEEDEKDSVTGERLYDSEDELAKGRRRYFPRTSGEIRVLLS